MRIFCHPPWQGSMSGLRLKLHSLQSVWTARRLPGGEHKLSDIPKNTTETIFDVTYAQDPDLNTRITHLHMLARNGACEGIQQHIDAPAPRPPLAVGHASSRSVARPAMPH